VPDLVALAVAFTLGSACAYAAPALWRRRRTSSPATTNPAGDPQGADAATPNDPDQAVETATNGLASELADLATGMEGHAQHLCEAIGNPELVAAQAQRLWANVRKLRLFSEKVVASCRPSGMPMLPTNVGALLTSLRQELEDYSGAGLQVKCEVASSLPLALAHPEGLRRACLFLVDSLLDLETHAGVLELRASNRVSDDRANSIEVTIRLETGDVTRRAVGESAPSRLGFVAASRLIRDLGAELSLEQDPGVYTVARLHLDAASPDAQSPKKQPPATAPADHPFGGIVIVEDDLSVRNVIAREMEKTGRRVFCCADGAAARSLFAATPERFELLILDREARRLPGVVLASEAVSLSPQLKVLLLGAEPHARGRQRLDLGVSCRVLHKPFGVNELRDAVNDLLGVTAAAPSEA